MTAAARQPAYHRLRHAARHTLHPPTPPETPEKKQRCPQLWLQPIMARAAMAHPNVNMLYSHEYIDYSENSEGITATVRNLENGETRAIAASYLLACDGATSLARSTTCSVRSPSTASA